MQAPTLKNRTEYVTGTEFAMKIFDLFNNVSLSTDVIYREWTKKYEQYTQYLFLR